MIAQDTESPEPTETPGGTPAEPPDDSPGETPADTEPVESPDDVSPKTGDNLSLFIASLLLSLTIASALFVRKRIVKNKGN